jgi:hypothetical protein
MIGIRQTIPSLQPAIRFRQNLHVGQVTGVKSFVREFRRHIDTYFRSQSLPCLVNAFIQIVARYHHAASRIPGNKSNRGITPEQAERLLKKVTKTQFNRGLAGLSLRQIQDGDFEDRIPGLQSSLTQQQLLMVNVILRAMGSPYKFIIPMNQAFDTALYRPPQMPVSRSLVSSARDMKGHLSRQQQRQKTEDFVYAVARRQFERTRAANRKKELDAKQDAINRRRLVQLDTDRYEEARRHHTEVIRHDVTVAEMDHDKQTCINRLTVSANQRDKLCYPSKE